MEWGSRFLKEACLAWECRPVAWRNVLAPRLVPCGRRSLSLCSPQACAGFPGVGCVSLVSPWPGPERGVAWSSRDVALSGLCGHLPAQQPSMAPLPLAGRCGGVSCRDRPEPSSHSPHRLASRFLIRDALVRVPGPCWVVEPHPGPRRLPGALSPELRVRLVGTWGPGTAPGKLSWAAQAHCSRHGAWGGWGGGTLPFCGCP